MYISDFIKLYSVLVFYRCITNDHKPSGLKQHKFNIPPFPCGRSLSTGSHQAEIKVSAQDCDLIRNSRP